MVFNLLVCTFVGETVLSFPFQSSPSTLPSLALGTNSIFRFPWFGASVVLVVLVASWLVPLVDRVMCFWAFPFVFSLECVCVCVV